MPTTAKKTFDCVAMKRRGAQALRQKLEHMTPAHQQAYWQQRTDDLRRRQRDQTAPDESRERQA